MDVYDHNGCIIAGAIESVAEQILQCNASQLDKLLKQVGGYDLESIRTDFKGQMYFVLLRKRADNQRCFLLVAYYDDTLLPEQGSSSDATNPNASLDGKSTADTITPAVSPISSQLASETPPHMSTGSDLKISPLKAATRRDIHKRCLMPPVLTPDATLP
ncbi:hypothetical protein LIER_25827 [Lithospermum erythrorhizon]|uniref:Uncharacterized protein n=1 Tax=Lithospermum erythrorhizon TaxID=34254 RepID=A0AAV3R7S3_LITER